MDQLGRVLILFGMVLAALGALLLVVGKVPWLGRLPGDITIQRGRFTFYFPLATCLLVSLVLTLLMWLLSRLR